MPNIYIFWLIHLKKTFWELLDLLWVHFVKNIYGLKLTFLVKTTYIQLKFLENLGWGAVIQKPSNKFVHILEDFLCLHSKLESFLLPALFEQSTSALHTSHTYPHRAWQAKDNVSVLLTQWWDLEFFSYLGLKRTKILWNQFP